MARKISLAPLVITLVILLYGGGCTSATTTSRFVDLNLGEKCYPMGCINEYDCAIACGDKRVASCHGDKCCCAGTVDLAEAETEAAEEGDKCVPYEQCSHYDCVQVCGHQALAACLGDKCCCRNKE